jgi:hypothetical protein
MMRNGQSSRNFTRGYLEEKGDETMVATKILNLISHLK